MINLFTGGLPIKQSRGVFQVIQHLRELGGYDDRFTDMPDEIEIPAVSFSLPEESFSLQAYGNAENPIVLKILDRNSRYPKLMLSINQEDPSLIPKGKTQVSFVANPFKDIKHIEEYGEYFDGDTARKYTLVRIKFERMAVTFLRWKEPENKSPNNENEREPDTEEAYSFFPDLGRDAEAEEEGLGETDGLAIGDEQPDTPEDNP